MGLQIIMIQMVQLSDFSGQLDTLTTILHSDNTLLLPNSARVKAGGNVRVIWEVSFLSYLVRGCNEAPF